MCRGIQSLALCRQTADHQCPLERTLGDLVFSLHSFFFVAPNGRDGLSRKPSSQEHVLLGQWTSPPPRHMMRVPPIPRYVLSTAV